MSEQEVEALKKELEKQRFLADFYKKENDELRTVLRKASDILWGELRKL